MIKFVDIFAGIGGIRKGLEISLSQYGIYYKCVFSCEINKKSQQTYRINFGEYPNDDIKLIDSLPDHDILLAGFPCQAFSYAGRQQGFADTRGTLFFEIERLLSSMKSKPQLLLLENVRGLLSHDKGRTYKTIASRLEKLGYELQVLLLNSSDFGVPQNRVRVYIIGTYKVTPKLTLESNLGSPDSHKFKKRYHQLNIFDLQNSKALTKKLLVKDILESNVDIKYICSQQFLDQLSNALGHNQFETLHGMRLIDYRGGNSIHSWDLGIKGYCSFEERNLMNAVLHNRRKKTFGTHRDGKELTIEQIKTFWHDSNIQVLLDSLVAKGYLRLIDNKYNPTCGNMSFEVFKFLDPESISVTVVASDAHRLGVVQNNVPRRITPRECARLQGFPDDFILHDDDSCAYRQLGNSVSVPIITAIFNDLINCKNYPFNQYFNKRHPISQF